MSDTLSWLFFVHHRVLSELQSSQKRILGPFLRGEFDYNNLSIPGLGNDKSTDDSKPFNTSTNSLSHSTHPPRRVQSPQWEDHKSIAKLRRKPCFRAWCSSIHHLIPLAVVSDSIFSLSTSSARDLIRDHFQKRRRDENAFEEVDPSCGGFEEVFTLHLSGGSGNEAISDAARQACIASLKASVDRVVYKARKECHGLYRQPPRAGSQSVSISSFPLTQAPDCQRWKRPREPAEERGCATVSTVGSPTQGSEKVANPSPSTRPTREKRVKRHRFLIAVSCTMDASRSTISLFGPAFSSGGGAGRRGGAGVGVPGSTLSSGAVTPGTPRRHSHSQRGVDLLHVFLADLAALYQRTRSTCTALSKLATGECTGPGEVPLRYSRVKVHQIHFAVMLIPEDDACGSAKLAQSLSPLFGKEFLIRCFDREEVGVRAKAGGRQTRRAAGQPANVSESGELDSATQKTASEQTEGREEEEEEDDDEEEEPYALKAAHRVLRCWDPVAESAMSRSRSREQSSDPLGREWNEEQTLSSLLLSEGRYFFMRPTHLPLVWFLWHGLQLFPVLLPPTWLSALQRLWASRRRLEDVVYAFHSMLMPFTLSHANGGHPMSNTTSSSLREASSSGGASHPPRTGLKKLSARRKWQGATDLLNALYEAAEVMATQAQSTEEHWKVHARMEEGKGKGKQRAPLPLPSSPPHFQPSVTEPSSSHRPHRHLVAVFFSLLYEDLVHCRPSRLLRFPHVVQVLASLDGGEETGEERLDGTERRSSGAMDADIYPSDKTARGGSRKRRTDNPTELVEHPFPPEMALAKAKRVLSAFCLPFLLEDPSPSLPPTARHGTSAPPVISELHRSALLSTLPPMASLEQIYGLVRYQPTPVPPQDEDEEEEEGSFHTPVASAGRTPHGILLPNTLDQASGLSRNNFYGPFIPREVRVLHVLSAYAAQEQMSGGRQGRGGGGGGGSHVGWVSLAHIQWAAQLSDTALLSTLEVLRAAGLITVNARELTARTNLLQAPGLTTEL